MKIESGMALACAIATILAMLGGHIFSILLIICFMALTLAYFGGGFYFFAGKDLKDQNLVLSIVAGVFLSTAPAGTLYFLMGWPNYLMMVVIGLATAGILALLSITLRTPENWTYYNRMFTRSVAWTCVMLTILGWRYLV